MTVPIFVVATATVLFVGPRLARLVEAIAERLDLGQVLVGAVLLGVVTSLPGLVLTIVAAARGDAELATANALGGVAAQTLFLAIADLAYRRGTLSKRVPTREVAFQMAMLFVLLAFVMVGLGTSGTMIAGRVHPVSIALIAAYIGGLALSRQLVPTAGRSATPPADDRRDIEGGRGGQRGKLGELEDSPVVRAEQSRTWSQLWFRFGVTAACLAAAGFALAWSGARIAESTALSATSVGIVLTAVATSTPELVTAVAAARRGAIGLAAGDIIGGNAFDTLFIAAADVAHPGSLFAQASPLAVAVVGWVVLLNGILLVGLMRQGTSAQGADIESLAIIGAWLVGATLIVVT